VGLFGPSCSVELVVNICLIISRLSSRWLLSLTCRDHPSRFSDPRRLTLLPLAPCCCCCCCCRSSLIHSPVGGPVLMLYSRKDELVGVMSNSAAVLTASELS
jgi:hypothetical protein